MAYLRDGIGAGQPLRVVSQRAVHSSPQRHNRGVRARDAR